VLIIGSSGTLGQALTLGFGNKGYEVVAWDKEDIDVTSKQELRSKITSLHPQIIINATAYNAVDKAETDENERKVCFEINAEAPGSLATVAKELNAVFVHYSTNYVFSGEKREGYKEDDKPAPVNKYGESKLAGEEAVKEVGGHFYIVRLSRLFGIRGISPMSKRTFVEIMLSEVEKETLEVGNTEISAITYAPDLALLTEKLVSGSFPGGIYHGANSGECTWYEWATEIFKDLGRGPKIVPATHSLTPKATKHPTYATLLNTKLPPQRDWKQALSEFLKNI